MNGAQFEIAMMPPAHIEVIQVCKIEGDADLHLDIEGVLTSTQGRQGGRY